MKHQASPHPAKPFGSRSPRSLARQAYPSGQGNPCQHRRAKSAHLRGHVSLAHSRACFGSRASVESRLAVADQYLPMLVVATVAQLHASMPSCVRRVTRALRKHAAALCRLCGLRGCSPCAVRLPAEIIIAQKHQGRDGR